MNRYIRFRLLKAAVATVTLAVATPALAGPPLLCHPFEIGTARSLPWNGSHGWWEGRSDYKLENLVADTEALLTPSTPVIVRMETLRRAALYASADSTVASQLLRRLMTRAQTAEEGSPASALAWLDAAYIAEAFREVTMLSGMSEFRDRIGGVRAALGDADGYALIRKSIAARPDDPSIQFAAALIAADKNRTAYDEHAAKARAGASRDPLLARNINKVS
jgi:hypothetical protein